MKTIKVSDELVIKIDPNEWRLVSDRFDGLTLFMAAMGQETWSYRPEFARIRGLPSAGVLPVDVIDEVIVGWAEEDSAWHLGLLLGPGLAAERGGRWCQVARWSMQGVPVERQIVEEAGQALADVLGKRLRVIGPRRAVAPAAASPSSIPLAEPVAPSYVPPPIKLPLELGSWRLREIDIGLQLEHVGIWSFRTLWNLITRAGLAVLFIVISVLTLQSQYAAVQPAFLPYLGLVIGAGMAVVSLVYLVRLLRTEVIVVDTEEQQVRRHLDLTSDMLATYEFDEIAAVMATQIAQGGRQRGEDGAPDTMTHEGWLHLLLEAPRMETGKARDYKPDEAFVPIGYIESTEGRVIEAHHAGTRKDRQPLLLSRFEATTDVLRAAVLLAEAIGTEAYVDQR